MGYGGSTRRRLLGVLLGGAALGAALALAGTVTLPALRDRSQQELDQRARREVTRKAQLVHAELRTAPTDAPAQFRLTAERTGGLTLLRVDHTDDGILLLFKVRAEKTGTTLFGYQQSNVTACFQQLFPGGTDTAALREVPCPPVQP